MRVDVGVVCEQRFLVTVEAPSLEAAERIALAEVRNAPGDKSREPKLVSHFERQEVEYVAEWSDVLGKDQS